MVTGSSAEQNDQGLTHTQSVCIFSKREWFSSNEDKISIQNDYEAKNGIIPLLSAY